jgi:hypothetical protein
MNRTQQQFIRKITSPLSYFWFMLLNLPSVIFWGIKIKTLNMDQCQTKVPFNWRTQNPFNSIYFSALAGTAELASGILCMLHAAGNKKISMLVTDFQAAFHKKAKSEVTMTCADGPMIQETLHQLTSQGQTGLITVTVVGKDEDGLHIGTFMVTWSFKHK